MMRSYLDRFTSTKKGFPIATRKPLLVFWPGFCNSNNHRGRPQKPKCKPLHVLLTFNTSQNCIIWRIFKQRQSSGNARNFLLKVGFAICNRFFIPSSSHLKVVNWIQSVDTWQVAILEAKKDISMVFICVSYILPDKQEIRLEGPHHFVTRFRQNYRSSNTPFSITIDAQLLEFSLFNPDIIITMNTFASKVFWPAIQKGKCI